MTDLLASHIHSKTKPGERRAKLPATWVEVWLRDNGIRGSGRAPKSILMLLRNCKRLIQWGAKLGNLFGDLDEWCLVPVAPQQL